MLERRRQELELVLKEYGDISIGPNLEWVVINRYKLPPGWSKAEVSILILIPAGYPSTPPDNFYTDHDLLLPQGQHPGNAGNVETHIGKQWRQFSYHVEVADWQPHADLLMGHNLLTFLTGVKQRLSETN